MARPKICIFKKNKIKNTSIKITNEKRKFKITLSFLFVDQRKLFAMKFYPSRNSNMFSSQRAAWLVFNQPRQRSLWRNFRYILHSMVKESKFLKGNFCIYEGFMDVFYILTSSSPWINHECTAKHLNTNRTVCVVLRLNYSNLIKQRRRLSFAFLCLSSKKINTLR